MDKETQQINESFWREHIMTWQSSGLTRLAYCQEHALNYRSFVYQSRRINRETKKTLIHFSEANLVKKTEASQAASLQLILPNGIRVGIGQIIEASLLETVLSIAGRISC